MPGGGVTTSRVSADSNNVGEKCSSSAVFIATDGSMSLAHVSHSRDQPHSSCANVQSGVLKCW